MSPRAAPPVSVVTPFYNTGVHLAECVESVLRQTHREFEYLLVDNRSTDDGAEIASRYARADSRIRVVTTPRHLTQVENFNYALQQISAHSDFCKLVLADDWIYPDCLRAMVDVGTAHPNVGIVSSYRLKGGVVLGRQLGAESCVVSGREIGRRHLLGEFFLFGSPTTLLLRSSIVRGRVPFYEGGRLHEDTDLCFELLKRWDFGFVHELLSFNRVEPGSRSGQAREWEPDLLDHLISIESHGADYLSEAELRERRTVVWRLYYQCLAENALRGRPAAFWEYHESGLRTIGHRVMRTRVAGHAARIVATMALHPIGTARRFRRFMTRRQVPSGNAQ